GAAEVAGEQHQVGRGEVGAVDRVAERLPSQVVQLRGAGPDAKSQAQRPVVRPSNAPRLDEAVAYLLAGEQGVAEQLSIGARAEQRGGQAVEADLGLRWPVARGPLRDVGAWLTQAQLHAVAAHLLAAQTVESDF